MHVAARARLVLARRPWIYWAGVATFAALAALAVHGEMASIAAERNSWGATRTVLVARHRLEPGDPIQADLVAMPIAVLPAGALIDDPGEARARQRVAAGEVLTELDVASGSGPAAIAEADTVVVALADPLARNVVPGLRVHIAADGLVVAESAEVTDVVDDVIFVAVSAREAPGVAAAAQRGIATLLYVP